MPDELTIDEHLLDTWAKATGWDLLLIARWYEQRGASDCAAAIRQCADHVASRRPALEFDPAQMPIVSADARPETDRTYLAECDREALRNMRGAGK